MEAEGQGRGIIMGSDTPTSPRAIYVLKSANGGLFYTPLYITHLTV